jgi:hypothetical protein
VKDEI